MWRLYVTCTTYHVEPSVRLGIHDTYVAYQLDQAVTALGISIENKCNAPERYDDKHREKYSLKDLLTQAQEYVDGKREHVKMSEYDKVMAARARFMAGAK
jgi:hypothetical protein